MSPNQELFGEIGYPTNDLSAIGKDDAGQAFPEDSLTDVPVTVGIPEGQKLQATGSTGAVDDSYARRWTYNTILVSAAMCSAIAYIVTLSH